MTRPPDPLIEQDAMRLIRIAARRGRCCHLRWGHIAALEPRLDDWLAEGLSGAAAARIRRALAFHAGVRLTADECVVIAS